MIKFIMKTFILLFCSVVFALSPKKSISQNSKIKVANSTTVTVDEVFSLIEEQTEYHFVYGAELFKNAPMVQLKKGTISTQKLLESCLVKTVFTYDFTEDNTIVLKRKPEFVGTQLVEMPQHTISGTVTDKEGNPLPGVNVLVGPKDSKTVRGIATDFDGKYSIKVLKGEVIKFSYLGFATQEFTIEDQSVLNVILLEDVSDLAEVVVTGFQKISKERVTGSYEKIDQTQLEKPAADISERLVGMVAGLQSTVNSDGSIDFEIRGQSSLYADQQPLVVYDGFPIEGGFNSINPNDVESITILKDAAAASIWGAKSANGVIVITSKKAEKGKTNISISSFLRASSKLDLDYVVGLASSSDIIDYEQKAFDSNFFGSPFGGPPSIDPLELDPFSQAITAMNNARLGIISNSDRDAILTKLRGINNESQIKKHLLQAPITKQTNIKISGGNDKMLNSLSLLYEDSNDYFIGNKVSKYLINFSNSIKVTEKLKFDFSSMLQFNDNTRNGIGLSTINSMSPFDNLVNEDGSLVNMSHLHYYQPNFTQFVPTELFPYSDWSYNPITEIKSRDLSTKRMNARIQTGLTLDIIDGLTVSSKFQYEANNSNIDNYYSDKSFTVRQFINETSSPDWLDGNAPKPLVPNGGILRQSEINITAYNFRNQLNFDRVFEDKHAVNLVVGSEISNRITKYTSNPDAFGYNSETLATSQLLGDYKKVNLWNYLPGVYAPYFYSFSFRPIHSFSEGTTRLFSMYGNLGYTYDNKYTITGSYRTDASNLITDDPKYRYNPFWSVGFGWQLSKEEFLSHINWIDRLNIRGTYGVNGNIDRSTSFKPLINIFGSLDDITQESEAGISSFGNPTLRWEKTKSFNLGIDFSILQGNLNGTLNVYNKKGSDLIVNQSIASVNGTTNQKFNNGEMLNKGFEIELGTSQSIVGEDIKWRGSINYSHNNNEITSFFKTSYRQYDLYYGPTSSYVEGHDANTLWSFVYAGMHNFGTDANPIMKPSIYGENGDKIGLTSWAPGNAVNYMEDQGSLVAPTNIGMRNTFKIYDFDFSFIVTAKFGHVFRRQSFNYPSMSGGVTPLNRQYSEVANGDPNKIIPIPETEGRYYFYDRFYPYMSYLTEDASHIRFQEVNLTYNVPTKFVDKIGLNSARVYTQANNLGTILFNDFGEDPEYPRGTIKPQTTVTFGVQLNF